MLWGRCLLPLSPPTSGCVLFSILSTNYSSSSDFRHPTLYITPPYYYKLILFIYAQSASRFGPLSLADKQIKICCVSKISMGLWLGSVYIKIPRSLG